MTGEKSREDPEYIEALKKFDVVGVTAGASTPDFLINEVCNTLEKL